MPDQLSPTPIGKGVCEFFAGIGLVHEGLRSTGWQCLYAGDIDAKKQAMYEGHYGPSPHFHLGDIWDTETVLQRIIAPPFLATASFPCTDMSLAGKRRGLAGRESGALLAFLSILARLGPASPKMVLLENVTGFLSSRGGEDFRAAVTALAQLGYWIDTFVVDARWFVPQSRPRLFVVGYHESLAAGPVIRRAPLRTEPDGPWERAVDRAPKLRPVRLRAVLDHFEPPTGWATVDCGDPPQRAYRLEDFLDADQTQEWWTEQEIGRHRDMLSESHAHRVELLCRESRPTLLTGFRRIRGGQQRLEVRFDGVAGCLRTPRGGSAKQVVLWVGRERILMRWMTPREYARLQGAADFRLPANTIQGLFGLGDAVCVPAIRWIDEHMLTPVFDAF
jgi:DNA (cytosine-5)-methyltransferase 1